jgi:hypothetical protein
VTVNSPNGGENLLDAADTVVTWDASGELGGTPVNIYFTVDGGSEWHLMVADTANDGYYKWTTPTKGGQILPAGGTQLALVRINVVDIYGNNVSDVSDMTFSIDPPPENPDVQDRVISPESGDTLTSGSSAQLQWLLSGEEQVSIYYSTDFGQTWNLIVEDIPNLQMYNWEIPENMDSPNVILKVSGPENSVLSGVFTIESGSGSGAPDDSDTGNSGADSVEFVPSALFITLIALFAALVFTVRQNPGRRK